MEKAIVWIVALLVIVPLVGLVIFDINGNFNDQIIESAVVNEKLVKANSSGSTYLIFTDKGVFANEDNIFRGKWNSSDVYAEITVGQTYNFEVVGYRIPFMSRYKNILEVN